MFKISLIVTSISGYDNLLRLFDSLNRQTISKDQFEIILIDQSVNSSFKPLMNIYPEIDIHHFSHNVVSLSKIRNFGISKCNGSILAFPDDDCWYYPDTLDFVYKYFISNIYCQSLCGRIYDTNTNKNLVKNWPTKSTKVTKFNYYFLSSATTLFTKEKLLFNEDIGPGTKYGSCEDVDYFFKLLNSNNFYYDTNLKILHPDMNVQELSLKKSMNYGLGFGYFFKNNLTTYNLFLFLTSLLYLLFRTFFYFIIFEFKYAKVLIYSFYGRILPFFII